MSKQGEIHYLEKLGKAGIAHAIGKPFSDINCGAYLAEIGAIITLIGGPSKKILDVGCGTGWTSRFLARRGHTVIGIDISPGMIHCAEQETARENLHSVTFITGDFETMEFKDEFDVVLFFDSLHHADAEEKALRSGFHALKENGICILAEPGKGHDKRGADAAKTFDVNEKDMNPRKTAQLAKKIGFGKITIYPRLIHATQLIYGTAEKLPVSAFFKKILGLKSICLAAAMCLMLFKKRNGITVMKK